MSTVLLAMLLRLVAAEPLTASHWAFQPLRPTPPPATGEAPAHPIDRFLLARLQSAGLKPAPPATAGVWLRRVHLDLTGLPPTPEEVRRFEGIDSPAARTAVIDRLLASPAHGERWARHWLDVVRFGESQGFEYDAIRNNAWRYRDWVIQALNADMPYPDFVRQQIAGDVLEPVTADSIAATGMLVAGPWDQAGNSSASTNTRLMVREAEMEDIVGTVGQTFLGLTLNCARCHNHKFDPIPQADYYRVRAVFAGVYHGERPLVSPSELERRKAAESARTARLAGIDSRLRQLDSAAEGRSIPATPGAAAPFARWSFNSAATDATGGLGGTLEGGAVIAGSRLRLDGTDDALRSKPLGRELRERTLEAWVTLDALDQRGGGVLSVESENGSVFDAIVFGELHPGRWVAGSEGHRRSRNLDLPAETSPPDRLVHVALTHAADGTIALYRDGQPYGAAYRPEGAAAGAVTFAASARILIGQRHTGGASAFLRGAVEEARVYSRALSADEVAASFRNGPDAALPPESAREEHRLPAEREERAALLSERGRLLDAQSGRGDPVAYAVNVRTPPPTHVLSRGEPDKPGALVSPSAPGLLGFWPGDLALAPDAPEGERRIRLANWIASTNNPLTARTIVNRVWQHHFGRGIVATPNDFGRMGEAPTHPELLDWLAAWFIDPAGGAGSLKRLHRLIVTSDAYARASQPPGAVEPPPGVDPVALLAWFPPRRLDAETVRDLILATSGELNLQYGGPGFRPFEHKGKGGQNEYFAADLIGPDYQRRTVYRICVHSARDPMLDSLDCPEFSTRTPVRPTTTTPLQALSLMHGSFVQRHADRVAERVRVRHPRDPAARVSELWWTVLGRAPAPEELRRALPLDGSGGLPDVAWALFNSNEFVHLR